MIVCLVNSENLIKFKRKHRRKRRRIVMNADDVDALLKDPEFRKMVELRKKIDKLSKMILEREMNRIEKELNDF